MSIRKSFLLAVGFLSLGLVACASGFKAIYDSDPSHDFSVYKTYAWMSANPMIVGQTSRPPSPLPAPPDRVVHPSPSSIPSSFKIIFFARKMRIFVLLSEMPRISLISWYGSPWT